MPLYNEIKWKIWTIWQVFQGIEPSSSQYFLNFETVDEVMNGIAPLLTHNNEYKELADEQSSKLKGLFYL